MFRNRKTFFIILAVLVLAFVVMLVLLIQRDQTSKDESATLSTNTNTMTEVATSPYSFPGVLDDATIKNKQARITTAKGDIVFELYPDDAPMAVSNFVYLAESGFYDGLTFHRVVSTVDDSSAIDIIQGGDPLGTGSGGPGYSFDDEDVTKDYVTGVVAMANAGPDTNGSQFFINTGDNSEKLSKDYTIFGKVTEGLDVAQSIQVGDVMEKVTIEDVSA